jgi:hypothetical protein
VYPAIQLLDKIELGNMSRKMGESWLPMFYPMEMSLSMAGGGMTNTVMARKGVERPADHGTGQGVGEGVRKRNFHKGKRDKGLRKKSVSLISFPGTNCCLKTTLAQRPDKIHRFPSAGCARNPISAA